MFTNNEKNILTLMCTSMTSESSEDFKNIVDIARASLLNGMFTIPAVESTLSDSEAKLNIIRKIFNIIYKSISFPKFSIINNELYEKNILTVSLQEYRILLDRVNFIIKNECFDSDRLEAYEKLGFTFK